MPGGLNPCACGACLPCVTWERDAALNRIDRALHVLDTGKHFVPLRVRAILAGEASGKDTVPMVRAEVADGLRTRIAELAAELETTRYDRGQLRAGLAEALAERDTERAMRVERESLLDGARDREAIHEAAIAQATAEMGLERQRAAWQREEISQLMAFRDKLLISCSTAGDIAREKALEEAARLVYAAVDAGELKMTQGGPLADRIKAIKPNPRRGDE